MAGKTRKAPGIFRKPIKKTKWEKNYLKKLYLPEDKKFLSSLVVDEGDVIRIDASGLSKKELKRLKSLGKAIKSNRKSMNFILLFILVLLVAGGVFFEVYLKDRLVQKSLENQLEGIFLAQVDTAGVDLSILKGNFSLDYLAIANAREPMKNLFECSQVTADIDTAALLQGRVYLESLGFEGLKRNTDRKESGELPAEREEPSESSDAAGAVVSKSRDAVAGVVNQLGVLAGDMDVEAILAAQKENLKSFKAIEDAREKVETYADTWQSKAKEWENEIAGWTTSVQYIRTVNADSFSTIEGAQSTITKLESLYKDAEKDYQAIQEDYKAAEQQYHEAAALAKDLQSAMAADYAYLEDLVTIPEGGEVDWVASILEDQLLLPVGTYLAYLDRGLTWYHRFKRLADSKKEKTSGERRVGRSLPPPAAGSPKFVLKRAYASGEEPELHYDVELTDLVSEPDIWDEKTTLRIAAVMPSTGAAEAVISEDSLRLTVPEAPFELKEKLKDLDIDTLSGSLAIQSGVNWDDTGFSGSLNLTSENLALTAVKEDSVLFRLINTTVESLKPFTAEGGFRYGKDGALEVSLTTEMDDRLGDAASALLAEGAEEGLKLLKEHFGDELEEPLAQFNAVKEDLSQYIDRIENYEQELDRYRRMADDKIAEIEQSVKDSLAKQAEQLLEDAVPDDVKDTAKDAADSLLDNLGSPFKF